MVVLGRDELPPGGSRRSTLPSRIGAREMDGFRRSAAATSSRTGVSRLHQRRRIGRALVVLVFRASTPARLHQVTRLHQRLDARHVVVSQQGVTTMHMSSSAVPEGDLGSGACSIRTSGGGRHAATRPMMISTSTTDRLLSYVIGLTTTTRTRAVHALRSRSAPGHGEVVVDRSPPTSSRFTIGDTITCFGVDPRTSRDSRRRPPASSTRLRSCRSPTWPCCSPTSVSYVPRTGRDCGCLCRALRDRIAAAIPDVTVQTRRQPRPRRDGSCATWRRHHADHDDRCHGYSLTVIGLALYALTVQKFREYGVYKALGATSSRLAARPSSQAAWTVARASTLAFVLAHAIALGVPRLRPTIEIDIVGDGRRSSRGLARRGMRPRRRSMPLRRVLALDPASAFRR